MNKELEKATLIANEIITHKEDFDYAFGAKIQRPLTISHEAIRAIETVLKELKSLQQENKDLKQANREKADKLIEITDLYMRSIPKDKIREKIEELQDMKVDGEVFITAVNFSKKILEELLEEK